jgi:hypothetical protein
VPYSTPYPSCIFCGGRADSREHAIPAWMSKRLGIKEQIQGRSVGMAPPRHPLSFASHRGRILCKGCNTHFKHLEDAAIPLLVPMATDLTLALGPESREQLALWASKTAMALLATQELGAAVPREHRESVRYRDEPPTPSYVGYFRWSGNPSVQVGEDDLRTVGPDEALRGRTYSAILTFRSLAFHVVGFLDDIPNGFTIRTDGYPVPFWPRTPGMIHWPPAYEAADAASVENLYRMAPLVSVKQRS